MKRILIFIVTILIALICFGCKGTKKSPINSNDNNKEISYKVDQITLSKSFQSTDPSVELMPKRDTIKILASLGLTESSGVKINKLVRNLNEVNIHVTSLYEDGGLQLAVPQVILELNKNDFNRIEELKFNIINDDYRPLKIKLGVNEVLSKIQSHFKISSSGLPIVNLTRLKDSIVWDISYYSIFDRESSKTPLVNLTAMIDANNGNILESKKIFISSSIDDGHILDYIPQSYILYKRSVLNTNNEQTEEQLWSYDLSSKEKTMIFSSSSKIYSSKYSNNSSYVSIIETSDKGSELYIVPNSDKKAYKISFEDNFNPNIMTWSNDNTLYLISNVDDKSLIFSYNAKENISTKVTQLDKHVENLVIKDDMFLIAETSENTYNKKLYLTSNWKDFDFITDGFSPHFIGDNTLAYLKNDETMNTNSLSLYNLKNKEISNIIKENISSFQILTDDSIAYIKKNPNYNNFTLSKYSLREDNSTHIASLVSDKVYYDEDNEVVYANISLPFENDKPEMIYLINLSKLN